MPEKFSVVIKSGETLSGYLWEAKEPSKNLCVMTGMNEYALRYAPLAEYMIQQGVSVRVLDAFGQGLNAESAEKQQIWPDGAFSKNVDGIFMMLKEAKKNGLPTFVMGHSMGSFMVQSLIERYPKCADGVILCGSNGGQHPLMVTAYGLARVLVNKKNREKHSPILQNLSLGAYSKAIADRSTDLDWLSYDKENVREYIEDPWCGHENTGGFWLEFLRGMTTVWSGKSLAKIDKGERIFIIAGQDDPVGQNGKGPQWLYDTYRKLGIQDVTLRIYPKMRHEILREKDGESVMQDILQFMG